jgi:integrase/recombinase XerD
MAQQASEWSNDPATLIWMWQQFLQWLQVRNYSRSLIRTRQDHLKQFIDWCADREIHLGADVDRKLLARYQQWLYVCRRSDGQVLSVIGQAARISSLRVFFHWLTKREIIASNPASELESPKLAARLPRAVLTHSEIETVLLQPNLETVNGLRDRAILETFYSTGIRRAELAGLCLMDLDRERGMLWVRCGKGGKDRVVPIGERALAWIEKYLAEARWRLVRTEDEWVLFVTRYGKKWNVPALSTLVHEYVAMAGLEKSGACHMLRHTCATLMLEGGADITYIQQMLGHEKLSTTQIYTLVSNRKLKQVHSETHPGAKLRRQPDVAKQAGEDIAD